MMLMRCLVFSKFCTERRQAFEMRCYRKLMNISYKEYLTIEQVRRKIKVAIGEYDELLNLVKKRKLRLIGHFLVQQRQIYRTR